MDDERVAKRVTELAERLRALGIRVADDAAALGRGEEWLEYNEGALRSSDAIVAIVSPGDVDRSWLYWEMGVAAASGKRFFLVAFDDFDPESLPMLLRAVSYVSWHSPEETASLVASALAA